LSANPASASAIKRPAGRVIVADAEDRVLLIRNEDPTIDEPIL
jgi:hypothetical protein